MVCQVKRRGLSLEGVTRSVLLTGLAVNATVLREGLAQIKACLNRDKIRAALRDGPQKESLVASRHGLVRLTRVASNGVAVLGPMASPFFGRATCIVMAVSLVESRSVEGHAPAPTVQKAFLVPTRGQKGVRVLGGNCGGLT